MRRHPVNWPRRAWLWVLPHRFFYADRLTVSAKQLLTRAGIGVVGLIVGSVTAGLLDVSSWQDVLAGALLAWSVSIIVWAVSSYQRGQTETRTELRRTAEVDLLHARLNQIAAKVGARKVILDYELEHALGARTERLAHFTGLDEFRAETHLTPEGYEFWDEDALGYPRHIEDDPAQEE